MTQAIASTVGLQGDHGTLSGHLRPEQTEGKASVPGTRWVALLALSSRTTSVSYPLLCRVMQKGLGSPFSSPFTHLSLGPFQELLGNVIEGEGGARSCLWTHFKKCLRSPRIHLTSVSRHPCLQGTGAGSNFPTYLIKQTYKKITFGRNKRFQPPP